MNEASDKVPEIDVHELKKKRDRGDEFFLLDVRNPDEYEVAQMGGHLIPLPELPQRLSEVPKDREIVIHCRSGKRSASAAEFLIENGLNEVYNLKGGIIAWANEIDPSLTPT